MNENLLTYSLLIFAAALVGGLLPLWRKWSDELLHMFVSFGAGIFIGTVFLHLLPEAFSVENINISALFVLVGFLLIFFIERYFISRGNGISNDSHKLISIIALVGLSVHSIIAGFGLAISSNYEGLSSMIFFSIIAHKTTAAFSLSSLFLLAKMSFKRCFTYLVLFSMMTPLGAVIFGQVIPSEDNILLSVLLGLTAGTFLYVSTAELLPEIFHTKEKKWQKILLFLIGILIIGVLGD